ncbi:tripartite motif-containing protein 5 [Aphis gossypii]|uniref:tripartite motif-containing protein 5 n=1 Tax=Aphis gossypii TaxID=80765 RepID=UPI00100FF1A2|nr:tripartite motif-containing protein 5 [Aphis gossypii]
MMDTKKDFEFEELIICGCCKQKFNETEFVPKELSCKHCFCLQCVKTTMLKGLEVYCINCWKRTELDEQSPETLRTQKSILSLIRHLANVKVNKSVDKERKGENCHTHGMPFSFWCYNCQQLLCRACGTQSDHMGHSIKSNNDARDHLISEVQVETIAIAKLMSEIQNLFGHKRQFLLRVLDACNTLKTQIELELNSGWTQNTNDLLQTNEALNSIKPSNLRTDDLYDLQLYLNRLEQVKQKVQNKYSEQFAHGQLEDIISSTNLLDFGMIKQSLSSLQSMALESCKSADLANPNTHIFFLANYCTAQLFTRYVLPKHVTQLVNGPEFGKNSPGNSSTTQYTTSLSSISSNEPVLITSQSSPPPAILNSVPSIRNVNTFPMFYFNIEVNGTSFGRLVIETRPDVAPKMSKNFEVLTVGDTNGCSYKGCSIFQCWDGESVITGDFELNNGRGGKSIYDESYFMPDDTKFPAVRGAVGMRRTQKRHDNMGMVGSQFRIILQEMRGFTAIFGHVVDGIDLVEKMASFGDQTGKPSKTFVISSCGKV